ncbi:HAD-IIB family hydrolase [Candidatus Mycoplasma haematominutum]|uniref:Haloacid dehalogenase-like hydrolase family protein n=1 Tax=Candidatus Mycoplasma haematominutum 'Birmingham 1' TaxID=1116213 RepID=G8C2V2_9MOLU|nr:HAD family hydrolase [Candidatus Mycoplasma haematominutum]CCE66650.1 haloacid dehalogenase-like hydrolase family protein [Candidatus Mycoplasma haematominutum 'Birmingham 1']
MSEKELKYLCKPQIKIIFSDLDGTLLSPHKWFWGKIRTYTLSTISKFLEDGEHHFILATGRNVSRALAISNWLEYRLGGYKIPYLICLNGGVLFDNRSKEVIYSQSFRCSQLLSLIQYLRRHYVVIFLILTEDKELYTDDQSLSLIVGRKFAKKYDAVLKISTVENYRNGWGKIQKVVFITLHKNSDKLRVLIETKFSEFYVATHGAWLFEVIDRKINKFSAIREIIRREGWALSECCGIGNEQNDVSMIEGCGFGAAVDFSPEITFKYDPNLINFYTSNVDGKAVARTIEKFST